LHKPNKNGKSKKTEGMNKKYYIPMVGSLFSDKFHF
jgi:hypothetical protein